MSLRLVHSGQSAERAFAAEVATPLVAFATLPSPVRGRAYRIICDAAGQWPALHARVGSMHAARIADVLVALEDAFSVLLEVDEVFDVSVADLLDIVETLVAVATMTARPEHPSAFQLYDFEAYRAAVGARPETANR